jgi:hypothetical protein
MKAIQIITLLAFWLALKMDTAPAYGYVLAIVSIAWLWFSLFAIGLQIARGLFP